MPTTIFNPQYAGQTVYARSLEADATLAAATELTATAAGLFQVADSVWHTATLPSGVHNIVFRMGSVGSPLATDPVVGTFYGFGYDGTSEIFPSVSVDVATLTAQVTAMLGVLQGDLPVKNDPSRTWLIRRGNTIVGSDTILYKHAADSAPFFADVRSLLSPNEHVQGTPALTAQAGLTMGTATETADIITLPQSGGTAANDYEITVSFATTNGITMACTMTLGVI